MPEALEGTAAFEQLLARAEELTRSFENHAIEAVREDVFELLQAIDAIHREAVTRLVELVARSGDHALVEQVTADPRVRTLLQLYDLLPLPEQVKWMEAVDALGPLLEPHRAAIELLRVSGDMPHLRLRGDFTPAQEIELRSFVQEQIAGSFGAYQSVRWEPAVPRTPPQLVAIQPVRKRVWLDLMESAALPPGALRGTMAEGVAVMAFRLGEDFRSYPDACPGTALPLRMGKLEEGVLHCPWHGCRFDAATGKRVGGTGADLQPLEVRVEGGMLQLGIWK